MSKCNNVKIKSLAIQTMISKHATSLIYNSFLRFKLKFFPRLLILASLVFKLFSTFRVLSHSSHCNLQILNRLKAFESFYPICFYFKPREEPQQPQCTTTCPAGPPGKEGPVVMIAKHFNIFSMHGNM